MKTQFLPLLAITTWMGFTASVAQAYNHDSMAAMTEASGRSQVYVVGLPSHKESEPHLVAHKNRESVRETNKQVVSLVISIHPHCASDR